jgi:GTP cyclohydrolase I
MILVREIELYSTCEHHMLPFFGKAHVAYIHGGRKNALRQPAHLRSS